jgi:methylated-DNA-[protein]-cysteine S-methyltransferase
MLKSARRERRILRWALDRPTGGPAKLHEAPPGLGTGALRNGRTEVGSVLSIGHISIKTPLGVIYLAATPKGLFYVNFGTVDVDALRRLFAGRKEVGFTEGGSLVEKAAREVTQYLDGRLTKFSVPLDLTGWSPFAKKVWRATSRIPFGETRAYAWIADRVGGPNFARAVGGALGSNPVPIVVPCHRVVGARGELGGYTGGLWIKRWLLEFEEGSQPLPLA